MSRLFDKDKDGKLNPEERKAAEAAIASGMMDKLVWGLEAQGKHRGTRILQKRGVIIDHDDFSGITKTYPDIERPKPAHSTRELLNKARKQ